MHWTRERRIVRATAVLAVGVPVGAARVASVSATAALAEHLGAAGGRAGARSARSMPI